LKHLPTKPKPDVLDGKLVAQKCGIVVRARREEGGFDVRRSRQMRAAWKAMGNAGEAQVGHLGLPHAFLPAGDFTSMVPQLAITNLREEKKDIFLRGVRGKAAAKT
jgi:hypothetical protein